MNFREAEQYLYSLGNEVSAMKLGLENIRKLLDALGNPQSSFLKVQVAGTNGKGSVCAFLDSICNTAGINTGAFTSPHLVSITERVRINGSDISEGDFARHANRVRETAEQMLSSGALEYRPTFFEHITAIALVAFAEAGVELAILETGLGGRLDATTAANTEIAVITRIDFDHQEYLGETLEEIAGEKAAIIREQTKAIIIGEQEPEAMSVIENRIRTACVSGRQINTCNSLPIESNRLGLNGLHQRENALIAVAVANELRSHFRIRCDDIAQGLQNARHPGRLEYQGNYLFDGAHNVGGAKALAEYINEFEKRPITIIFGAMREKSVSKILDILEPIAERIIFTEPANSRALSHCELLENLSDNISRECIFATDKVSNAIDVAETITTDDGIILVTGSLYLVGEAKKILNNERRCWQVVGIP